MVEIDDCEMLLIVANDDAGIRADPLSDTVRTWIYP
jgi:hypothetical protein